MLQWVGRRRSRLQQQLEEENIKATNLATKVCFPKIPSHDLTSSKVEEMDMMLRQREEQVASLERELDKQRELREAQVTRESFRYKTHKVQLCQISR